MSIQRKIAAALWTLVFISVISAGFTLMWQQRSAKLTDGISTSWVPALDNINTMQQRVLDHKGAVEAMLMSGAYDQWEKVKQVEADLQVAVGIYTKTLDDYLPEDRELELQERKMLEDYTNAWNAYRQSVTQVQQQVEKNGSSGMSQEEKERFLEALAKQSLPVLGHINTIMTFNIKGTDRDAVRAQKLSTTTMSVSVGALVVMMLVGGALSIWMPKTIATPLREAVQKTHQLANKDLSQSIRSTSADEVGQLLTALEQMRTNWVQVMGKLQESSRSIASAGGEIASGNADLSSRTEQTAASLEQSAAAMEHLKESIAAVVVQAQQVSQSAQQSAQKAQQSGQLVGQVVQKMQHIEQGSQKMSQIIGVIDSIAFQTNILALNAAVEAARAGEQGRGFAVVVTDGPLANSLYYNRYYPHVCSIEKTQQAVLGWLSEFKNIDLYIARGDFEYEQAGRYQNETRARQMDAEIEQCLREYLSLHKVSHNMDILKVCQDIAKVLQQDNPNASLSLSVGDDHGAVKKARVR